MFGDYQFLSEPATDAANKLSLSHHNKRRYWARLVVIMYIPCHGPTTRIATPTRDIVMTL